jgi:FkbM family methyltransferase
MSANPITGPARAVRRRLVRALPEDRRVKSLGGARGRGWLQARLLVSPLFQRPVTLTTESGLRLRVGTDPVDEKIAQLLLGRHRSDYFPDWPYELPTNPCILDVGSHHGLYAASALHEFPGSRIICVEPSAEAVPSLRRNLAINEFSARARIVNAALAPAAGVGSLLHTYDGTWGYSLYEEPSESAGAETVRLATLDEILAGDRPDIIKSNAEGAEFALIEQLARTDIRPSFMTVMVHPQFGDMPALEALATSMGYRVEHVGLEHRPALHFWRETP